MSRKPNSPEDHGPAGNSDQIDIPAGRRYSSNKQILEMEKELVAEGRELPNRAIPIEYHPQNKDYDDVVKIREMIERETEKDAPNRQLIGLLNAQL